MTKSQIKRWKAELEIFKSSKVKLSSRKMQALLKEKYGIKVNHMTVNDDLKMDKGKLEAILKATKLRVEKQIAAAKKAKKFEDKLPTKKEAEEALSLKLQIAEMRKWCRDFEEGRKCTFASYPIDSCKLNQSEKDFAEYCRVRGIDLRRMRSEFPGIPDFTSQKLGALIEVKTPGTGLSAAQVKRISSFIEGNSVILAYVISAKDIRFFRLLPIAEVKIDDI